MFYRYSLLHAATSYGHTDLMRILVRDFRVDVNIKDEDGETALFAAESVEVAQMLVEDLGANLSITNDEGETAEDKIRQEGDYPIVAAYLKEARLRDGPLSPNAENAQAGSQLNGNDIFAEGTPDPVPPNMKIEVGTMEERQDIDGELAVDPDFRKRIEELASRGDFHSEASQSQLRNLVQDAVHEVDVTGTGREVRQRLE